MRYLCLYRLTTLEKFDLIRRSRYFTIYSACESDSGEERRNKKSLKQIRWLIACTSIQLNRHGKVQLRTFHDTNEFSSWNQSIEMFVAPISMVAAKFAWIWNKLSCGSNDRKTITDQNIKKRTSATQTDSLTWALECGIVEAKNGTHTRIIAVVRLYMTIYCFKFDSQTEKLENFQLFCFFSSIVAHTHSFTIKLTQNFSVKNFFLIIRLWIGKPEKSRRVVLFFFSILFRSHFHFFGLDFVTVDFWLFVKSVW